MLLSLDWLKDYIDLPKTITPEELALRLTLHTVEIDSVTKQADKFNKVVVGKILEISKHPNADRLQVAKVDVKTETLSIVCGAPNIAIGQLIPVALVGAILPNGAEIKEAEVRGEKSFGMLCAPDELGLGDDHSGILILEERAKIGQNLSEYLKLEDVVFEVDNKSMTNRPDLWSHYGMARDIAAFLGIKLQVKSEPELKADEAETKKLNIKVDDAKLCPRYMAVAMSGIEIKPSPKWMQDRLIAAGMRPINNIVDITNYVMLDLGQPLHAFDQTQVDAIVVRTAKKGEIMETLDGGKRILEEGMLVIADSKKPIAVAGVMGGANSEINPETNMIIIESANFEPVQVRKTAQKLGLRTESSIRFEKSLDPNQCSLAILWAVELVRQSCPEAKPVSKLYDLANFKSNTEPIYLELDWLVKRIGQDIKVEKIIEIFTNLGFGSEQENQSLRVTVPSWRATKDISIPEDLVEEIARIYGYNNITTLMPQVSMQPPAGNEERMLERKIKDFLSYGAGLTEAYNYSFVGEEQLKKLNIDTSGHIRLVNPIAVQHSLLRQSLVPNLADNIRNNQAKYDDVCLYEIGQIYLPQQGELKKDDKGGDNLPYQEKTLSLAMASGNSTDLFARLKGTLEYLFTNLALTVDFLPAENGPCWAETGTAARMTCNSKDLGVIAMLDPKIARLAGVKKMTAFAEINLQLLLKFTSGQASIKYQEPPKFPVLSRDLAFVVDDHIVYNDIRDVIIGFSQLIKKVELFDIFRGGKLGEDKKNLAFHVIYQADRTLISEEVDKIQQELIAKLEEKFGAKIRNY